jgi:hypothetical protein
MAASAAAAATAAASTAAVAAPAATGSQRSGIYLLFRRLLLSIFRFLRSRFRSGGGSGAGTGSDFSRLYGSGGTSSGGGVGVSPLLARLRAWAFDDAPHTDAPPTGKASVDGFIHAIRLIKRVIWSSASFLMCVPPSTLHHTPRRMRACSICLLLHVF